MAQNINNKNIAKPVPQPTVAKSTPDKNKGSNSSNNLDTDFQNILKSTNKYTLSVLQNRKGGSPLQSLYINPNTTKSTKK